MEESIKEKAKIYALQNAVKYGGKANNNAVFGKILGEHPELKESIKEFGKALSKIIKEVNSLSLETQKKHLENSEEQPITKKEDKSSRNIFEFMDIREGQKVITAFPPEPSKYPHIGHAKAVKLNYELAKKYNGRFIIRFEDTNPKLAKGEFYKIHLENYEWLGIKPDSVDYASDYMEKFYESAEKLLKDNHAYVCVCSQKSISDNRYKGLECGCRYHTTEKNIELWNEMKSAKEGDSVLRLKGHMKSANTTMRDPTIIRIIDEQHPRTKKKYRLWPNYDFENAVMDGIEGVTHRLRSKEFELRSELQSLIQTMLGFPQTKLYHFARFNMEGVESSGRIIRELVEKKKLIGWDDPSLTTIAALRRRGFLAEAIKNFVMSTGITKSESQLKWDDLIVHNRRLLDPQCRRYFFVDNPVEIEIEGSPNQEVNLKFHPSLDKGTRKFQTNSKFYVAMEDFKLFKEGKLYRLMDCLNFTKKKKKFIFDSTDYEKYKSGGTSIIHWLPAQKELLKIEILMPDKSVKSGLGEHALSKLKEGEVVQLVRTGFARADSMEKNKIKFWFSHQ